MESALIISPPKRSASASDTADLPVAVAPTTVITGGGSLSNEKLPAADARIACSFSLGAVMGTGRSWIQHSSGASRSDSSRAQGRHAESNRAASSAAGATRRATAATSVVVLSGLHAVPCVACLGTAHRVRAASQSAVGDQVVGCGLGDLDSHQVAWTRSVWIAVETAGYGKVQQ